MNEDFQELEYKEEIQQRYIPILECVPEYVMINGKQVKVILRDVQRDMLLAIEANYHTHKIIIASMPVGSGKQIVAITYSIWIRANRYGKTAILNPTKMLQDQYQTNFPDIPLLKGAGTYRCSLDLGLNQKEFMSCRQTKAMTDEYCKGGCEYTATLREAKAAGIAIFNMHSFYFNRMWKSHVVIDEAHNIAPFLFDIYAIRLWQPEIGYEIKDRYTAEEVTEIIKTQIIDLLEQANIAKDARDAKLLESIQEESKRFENVLQALALWKSDILVVKKTEKYQPSRHLNKEIKHKVKDLKNTDQVCIYIKPLKVSSFVQQFFWPEKYTQKVLLLSSTIGPLDRIELGIEQGSVKLLESDSPIPPANRPFVIWPVASMSSAVQQKNLPTITDAILQIAKKHSEVKGLIHATYELAIFLRKYINESHPELSSRFLFHDQKNKNEVFKFFRAASNPLILVGSGMSEGIDLPEDAARFQVICKVMFPYLGDDVNKWRCHNSPRLYNYDAVKMIIQQSGRICRGPTDKGVTYMLDSNFLYLESKTPQEWPMWFKKATIRIKGKDS
jgi:Rad3-related DNA helicase